MEDIKRLYFATLGMLKEVFLGCDFEDLGKVCEAEADDLFSSGSAMRFFKTAVVMVKQWSHVSAVSRRMGMLVDCRWECYREKREGALNLKRNDKKHHSTGNIEWCNIFINTLITRELDKRYQLGCNNVLFFI